MARGKRDDGAEPVVENVQPVASMVPATDAKDAATPDEVRLPGQRMHSSSERGYWSFDWKGARVWKNAPPRKV